MPPKIEDCKRKLSKFSNQKIIFLTKRLCMG